MKFMLSFTSNILQIKKDVNYMSVSQQKDGKSGLQILLNQRTAFKTNTLPIVILIKLEVLIHFLCILYSLKIESYSNKVV